MGAVNEKKKGPTFTPPNPNNFGINNMMNVCVSKDVKVTVGTEALGDDKKRK